MIKGKIAFLKNTNLSVASKTYKIGLVQYNNENINKFGYAGNLHSEIFELQIPNWIKILQLTLPYENKKYKEKIFYLLEKYSNIEFRFFNVFSEIEDKENSMSYAKKILKDFPNTKIIFQTTSQERLKYNFDFFNS